MAANRQVDDLVTCGLTDSLYTGINSGPNARNEYGKILPYLPTPAIADSRCVDDYQWHL